MARLGAGLPEGDDGRGQVSSSFFALGQRLMSVSRTDQMEVMFLLSLPNNRSAARFTHIIDHILRVFLLNFTGFRQQIGRLLCANLSSVPFRVFLHRAANHSGDRVHTVPISTVRSTRSFSLLLSAREISTRLKDLSLHASHSSQYAFPHQE